jgi:hypothetical protein
VDTFDKKFFQVLRYIMVGGVILIILIQLKTIDDNVKYLIQVQHNSVDTTTTKLNVTEEEK